MYQVQGHSQIPRPFNDKGLYMFDAILIIDSGRPMSLSCGSVLCTTYHPTSLAPKQILMYAPLRRGFRASKQGLLDAMRGKMSKVANAIMKMEEGVENKSGNGAEKDGRGEGGEENADEDGDEDEEAFT
jgi:hypothetical protein